MPQVVELEALVCGCGEGSGKVACETMIDPGCGPKTGNPPLHPPPPDDPDLPAESFRLPVEDVLDWVTRNAAAAPYDRDVSARGVTNPKSAAPHHLNPKLHAGSLRRYAKPKALIIGLPNTIQSSSYLGQSVCRQHAANSRFFPKKYGDQSAGSGRTAVTALEPTSPKVSCFGKVLPDHDQSRRRKASVTPDVSRESSSEAASSQTWETTGFWASMVGLSCCGQRREPALLGEEEAVSSSAASPLATSGKIAPSAAVSGETVMAAPGLGGMKRFESGRRTASWGDDLELEVEDVARSGPPSPQRRGEEILPGRRSVDSLADLDRDRDWESAGAASV